MKLLFSFLILCALAHTIAKVRVVTHHLPATLPFTLVIVVTRGFGVVQRSLVICIIVAEGRDLKVGRYMEGEGSRKHPCASVALNL